MKTFSLSDAVQINSQFGRSVNLERDFYKSVSVDSYVPTTTFRTSLERIGDSINNPQLTRAWTLTGPFGAGKSAFALYVAKLLDASRKDNSLLERKHTSLDDISIDNDLRKTIESSRFIPILVSGAREPLAGAILRGIRTAVNQLDKRIRLSHIKAIEKLERSSHITGRELVELLNSISASVGRDDPKTGVLLIIDELGKLLEFAASGPSRSDIFLLQEIAEGTRGSARPLLFLSILHQAFERYAERLGERERDEWTKVQGRFEDILFKEPFEQTLRILRSVFGVVREGDPKQAFKKIGVALATRAYELGLCGGLRKAEAISLLQDCIPLHPLVASLLGPIFRKFGQNERSLFAFLTSSEPYGFAHFLRQTTWTNKSQEVVRLDHLYDYLVASMGGSLISGPDGRKWAEVESALLRIPEASSLEVRLLKTIGLFFLIGDFGRFKSSRELLLFALNGPGIDARAVDLAIAGLKKRSVITERRYNDTLVIWEGSDVDLDARFLEATKNVLPDASLAESLKTHFNHQPIVAKRHSARTGTLRFFEVGFVNSDVENGMPESSIRTDADAKILFVLAPTLAQRTAFEARVKRLDRAPNIVLAVPPDAGGLKELLWRVACWRWVLANTPQLETDRVARKELAARLAYSERSVIEWLDEWRGTGSGSATWYWQDEKRRFDHPRALQEFLSTVMDRLFPATPIIKNELVNRNVLSSAAAAARRLLLEGMITNADAPQLGITGYPPQLSMYFSLFQETTIHRAENDKYGFFSPKSEVDIGIQEVWKAIDGFLERTEKEKLTVADLFAELRKPPFGLKQGVLPPLITAIFLSNEAEVALYERGNFIPTLSLPALERMCRAPETFSVQLCRIAGIRSKVITGLAEVLAPNSSDGRSVDLLTVVRPLAQFAQGLPEFSQHTSRLSPLARNVRRALFSAREPSKLIFEFLPEACGFVAFKADEAVDVDKVRSFSDCLHGALSELKRSYKELLNEIESQIISAFALPESDPRQNLQGRSRALSSYAASVKLKGFILRASDSKLDHTTWLESIGAQVVGRPPGSWRDQDLSSFEVNLTEIARSFNNLEALVFERLKQSGLRSDSELIRINLSQISGGDHSKVVAIRSGEREVLKEAIDLLKEALNRSRINGNRDLRLATLAQLSLELLREGE